MLKICPKQKGICIADKCVKESDPGDCLFYFSELEVAKLFALAAEAVNLLSQGRK